MTQASMTTTADAARSAPPDARSGFRLPTHWLGVAPFFIFALMFLILPTLYLVIGAFQNDQGQYTLDNIRQLFLDASIRDAYWVSIKISFWSATIGAFVGLAMAIA
ncbi:MAG: acriflavin resistance protein, partial [Proteobacteria bacterium]|nr:acriflavin resistance protein [Pseudomonadota bacterium]